MRWAGHVARTGEMRSTYRILVGKPEGDHTEELRISERIILQWVLWKDCGNLWTGCIWLRIATFAGLL
jgi:hypothetical protein